MALDAQLQLYLLFSFSHFGYLLNNLLRKQNAPFFLHNDCVYCNSTGQFLWTLKMTCQGNQQMQNGYNVLVMYSQRKDPSQYTVKPCFTDICLNRQIPHWLYSQQRQIIPLRQVVRWIRVRQIIHLNLKMKWS